MSEERNLTEAQEKVVEVVTKLVEEVTEGEGIFKGMPGDGQIAAHIILSRISREFGVLDIVSERALDLFGDKLEESGIDPTRVMELVRRTVEAIDAENGTVLEGSNMWVSSDGDFLESEEEPTGGEWALLPDPETARAEMARMEAEMIQQGRSPHTPTISVGAMSEDGQTGFGINVRITEDDTWEVVGPSWRIEEHGFHGPSSEE